MGDGVWWDVVGCGGVKGGLAEDEGWGKGMLESRDWCVDLTRHIRRRHLYMWGGVEWL